MGQRLLVVAQRELDHPQTPVGGGVTRIQRQRAFVRGHSRAKIDLAADCVLDGPLRPGIHTQLRPALLDSAVVGVYQ